MEKDSLGISSIIDQLEGASKVMQNDEIAVSKGMCPVDLRMAAMNEIVALKLTYVRDVFVNCEKAINRIGSLDFSIPIETDETNHVGNYLAHSLNILMEELSLRVFPFQMEIIDSVSDVVLVTNLKGNIIRINKSFRDITGYTEEELINKPIADILEPKNLNLNLANGLNLKNLNINFQGKNKDIIPVILTVTEIKGYRNSTKGFTFIAQLNKIR